MVNKVILVGNVGQDPEIRFAQSGSKIATFSVATTESWKDRATGERKTLTQWHRIVVFNDNLSNIVESYVKKGSKVFIEGAIQSRKYTGNDGVERNITEVVISQFKGEITLLDSRNSDGMGSSGGSDYSSDNSSSKASNSSKSDSFSSVGDDLDDEIPF